MGTLGKGNQTTHTHHLFSMASRVPSREFNSRLSFSEGPNFAEKKLEKMENTYKMDPDFSPRWFGPTHIPKTAEIKEMANTVLENNLKGEDYDMMIARDFSRNLADEIKRRVQQMDGFPPRYKVMVMVFVGQRMESAEIRIASRMMGLKYDTFCDATFVGKKIFGCAQVYLVYQE